MSMRRNRGHRQTDHPRRRKRTRSRLSRREFLHLSGLGALGSLAAASLGWAPVSLARPRSTQAFVPDVEIALEAVVDQDAILPGGTTTVWRYRATLVQGPSDTLQPLSDSYLGPILNLRTGQKVRIAFTNRLPGNEKSIVHWHGLHVPEAADGHPRYAVLPGQSYVYEFTVQDRPGTYWYHPHPHGRTGPQVYRGLAGLIHISDPSRAAEQGLPTGPYDLSLVIQDRRFDTQNQLVYSADMAGFLGDRILVNGRPNVTRPVERTSYRLRLLNGSNARIYKLAWSDGTPLTVIGTDGGLLDQPVQRSYVTLGPAERVELLVDFGQWPADTTLTLRSLAFSVGGGNNSDLPNGAEFPVMDFQIQEASPATPTPASTPTPFATVPAPQGHRLFLPWVNKDNASGEAAQVQVDRTFALYLQAGQWTINGRTFEMEAVAPDEIVELGATEVWEFVNQRPAGPGGMRGMEQPHPMHIHGLQFRVLARQAPTDATQRANWETVKDGYVDEGWKDTVLLMPGERVQVQVQFQDYTGLFLYHCHNLEHEDMGMMRNYRVVAPKAR